MSDLVIKPRLSEKTYAASQALNVYVFDVDKSTNKHEVARAVEAQYKVTVVGVKTVVVKGKAMRTVRKGSRPAAGRRADIKKAYVTLKKGDSLPVFAVIEEEEKQAEKAEKADKKTTDSTEKAAKTVTKAESQQQKRGLRGVFARSNRQIQNRGGDK